MTVRKEAHAFVSGSNGEYYVQLSDRAREVGFAPLSGLPFCKYRAAQEVANAVKASKLLGEK